MRDRKPTAAARTLSIFTGQTDLDDREVGRARDGSPSEAPRRQPATRKPLKWEGGVTRWYVMDGPHGESYVITKDSHGFYQAAYFTRPLGRHGSILAAGDACEAHHRGES